MQHMGDVGAVADNVDQKGEALDVLYGKRDKVPEAWSCQIELANRLQFLLDF